MHRTLLIIALAATLTGSVATTAEATFPGRNGPIAFRAGLLPVSPGTPWPLFVAQPDGTQQRPLSDQPGLFTDWRADGRRIAYDFFEPGGDEQIATSRPDGGDRRVITAGPGIHETPSWSPDGRRIVFDFSPQSDPSAPGFETRLWTMRADGSQTAPLPMRGPGFDVEPKYSPDGRWITFGRIRLTDDGGFDQAVFIVGARGGRPFRLTPWRAEAEHPTWSPDSRWIAYDLPIGTIEAVRPHGRARRTILAHTEHLGVHKPWFSPDGSSVLFMCAFNGAGGDDDLCVMNTDGTGFRNITNTPLRGENGPSWGPTPS